MIDLSPDARAILEGGRDLDNPGDLERARVRRALLAKIAAGSVTAVATSTAAAGSSAAVSLPLAKILVSVALVVAGGVGGTLAWRAHRAPVAVAPVSTPAPVVVASGPLIAPVPVPVPAAPIAHRAAVHHAHVAAPVRDEAPANRLAEETALLAASNAELRSGDARRALALLNDYDRRYPSGVLREEVLATRVIAGCQLGHAPDAASRRAADAFLARHPASPLAPRVRSSCAR
jgi:hypothetical protein